MGVKVRVDGIMLLVLLVLALLVWLWSKKEAAIAAINPADPNNLVNRGVNALAGEENVSGFFDRVFGAIDLINPFNESDAYARQVYGLEGGSSPDAIDTSEAGSIATGYNQQLLETWARG